MAYFINGWKESKSYFFSVGHFTEREIESLNSGVVVEKGGNTFYIAEVSK